MPPEGVSLGESGGHGRHSIPLKPSSDFPENVATACETLVEIACLAVCLFESLGEGVLTAGIVGKFIRNAGLSLCEVLATSEASLCISY